MKVFRARDGTFVHDNLTAEYFLFNNTGEPRGFPLDEGIRTNGNRPLARWRKASSGDHARALIGDSGRHLRKAT